MYSILSWKYRQKDDFEIEWVLRGRNERETGSNCNTISHDTMGTDTIAFPTSSMYIMKIWLSLALSTD